MSAREKATGTKDSVSLLPCFYFVEVRDGSVNLLLISVGLLLLLYIWCRSTAAVIPLM